MSTATGTGTQTIDTHHTDTLHDAILDYYGKRLATCSADQTIKIFDVAASGTNTLQETLRGHEGPVWQLSWAHPKFGTILASAGYDGKVIIWREQGQQWSKLTEHAIHSASVNSVTWAPHELGAVLGCASADGKVSILEFRDDGSWDTRSFTAHAVGVNAISWAPATFAAPGGVKSGGGGGSSSVITTVGGAGGAVTGSKKFVTAGCDNALKIWAYDATSQTWREEATLDGHADWVRDVAWAPNLGLPKSYIASGSQDRTVVIWTQLVGQPWVKTLLRVEPYADTIWKVSWSESGNLLAVSCGDGKVYIYKESGGNTWVEVNQVSN